MLTKKMENASGSHELGTNHNNDKRNTNGMDEIDNWAANIGQSERNLNGYRPRRKHVACFV